MYELLIIFVVATKYSCMEEKKRNATKSPSEIKLMRSEDKIKLVLHHCLTRMLAIEFVHTKYSANYSRELR